MCKPAPNTIDLSTDGRWSAKQTAVSLGDEQRRGLASLRRTALLNFVVLLSLCFGQSALVTAQMSPPTYEIELGEAIVLPDQVQVALPVYLTSEFPIDIWEMGLDYDELLLSLVDVSYVDSVSEALNPVTLVNPTGPPYTGFQVVYPAGSPFPEGRHLAAWLVFDVLDLSMMPVGGSITSAITIINTEINPIRFELISGTTVIPMTSNGTITFYSPLLFRLDDVADSASPFDAELRLPIQVWTTGPANTVEMGLDYDELLLSEFDLSGGYFDTTFGGDVVVTTTKGSTTLGVLIEATNGSQIPLLNGETIGYLVIEIDGVPPFAGTFPIEFDPASCAVDMVTVTNLLGVDATIVDEFVRGDVNFDGRIDIGDVTAILLYLHMSGELPCRDAADANDDGTLGISDPIWLLEYLFSTQGQSPPPPPTQSPGQDPTPDPLDCLIP